MLQVKLTFMFFFIVIISYNKLFLFKEMILNRAFITPHPSKVKHFSNNSDY